jgi:hypothetical protein
MSKKRQAMTLDEILGLPPLVNVETAGRVLGIGKSKAYALLRDEQFPVRVVTLGKVVKVPTAGLWDILGVLPGQVRQSHPHSSASQPYAA